MAQSEPAGPAFHLFPRLPLELRQQIWKLSIEPREVVIGRTGYREHGRRSTPPPPLLLVCAESRSYIQRFYTKASVQDPSRPESLWVNFEIDELYMMDYDFRCFGDIPLIQRLTVVTFEYEWLYRTEIVSDIWKAKSLETLTVIDEVGACEFTWVMGWEGFMQELYFRCDPAPWYTKIVSGDDLVMTRDDWLKIERQLRRRNWGPNLEANHPDYDSDGVISEDDDDPRDSRYRPWEHTKECDCPQKKKTL